MPTKKVTATKTTASSAKRSAPRVRAKAGKHTLVCAQGEQCFWTTDGKVLSNVAELCDALASMSDEVFLHHANADKNDFANWVEAVLEDRDLAKSLRSAKKATTAHTAVARRLKSYATA